MILGMDWLTNYNTQIDCKEKKVTLESSDGVKVVFRGKKQAKRFLTMIQVKKLLRPRL